MMCSQDLYHAQSVHRSVGESTAVPCGDGLRNFGREQVLIFLKWSVLTFSETDFPVINL